METVKLEDFLSRLKAQNVPRAHLAVKCVMCGTVQSLHSLILAGAGKTQDEVEKYWGFSCVGRFTKAGPHIKGMPPGRGCDWTLGGLLRLHNMEVVDEKGQAHPHFEVASPEEAQALMNSFATPSVAQVA